MADYLQMDGDQSVYIEQINGDVYIMGGAPRVSRSGEPSSLGTVNVPGGTQVISYPSPGKSTPPITRGGAGGIIVPRAPATTPEQQALDDSTDAMTAYINYYNRDATTGMLSGAMQEYLIGAYMGMMAGRSYLHDKLFDEMAGKLVDTLGGLRSIPQIPSPVGTPQIVVVFSGDNSKYPGNQFVSGGVAGKYASELLVIAQQYGAKDFPHGATGNDFKIKVSANGLKAVKDVALRMIADSALDNFNPRFNLYTDPADDTRRGQAEFALKSIVNNTRSDLQNLASLEPAHTSQPVSGALPSQWGKTYYDVAITADGPNSHPLSTQPSDGGWGTVLMQATLSNDWQKLMSTYKYSGDAVISGQVLHVRIRGEGMPKLENWINVASQTTGIPLRLEYS